MATVTSTGVGSGLDVNSIVTSLMAVERRPLTLLQTRAATIQTRLSAYGTLQGQLAALGDVAARLADASAWQPMKVDSSLAAAVSATASAAGGAAPGHLQVEVQQLAQGQLLASGPQASSASVIGTGELVIQLGTRGGGGFTPGTAAAVHIPIDAAHQSLAGVRDAINAANAGVSASIVGTAGQARLVLRGPTGEANAFRLTVTDDDGQSTDTSGLSALAWDPDAAVGAGRQLTELQASRDALFTIDGLAQRSPRNQVEGAVSGVSLTLKQVTTAPVDLGVAVETGSVRKNIDDFVAAFNNLNRLLQQQTQADPSGKARGPLQGDSTPLALLAQLRNWVHGEVAGGAAGAPASLNALGITLQRDGALAVQEGKLATALAQPADLARLFASAADANPAPGAETGGLALRLKTWARRASGEEGSIATRLKGLKSSSEGNQKAQDAAQDRLARTEARLRAQYQRLDSDMSSLNARMAQMRASLGLSGGS